MTSVHVPVPAASNRPVLPSRGVAVVKSVLSGDTVSLLGRATTPNTKPPEAIFTFERVTSPRMASKVNNNKDEAGAFPAREYLRKLVVGKTVRFETKKQGATAGDRVYGLLYIQNPEATSNGEDGDEKKDAFLNIAVESVRRGFAIPKLFHSDSRDGEANENGDSPSAEDGKNGDADDYETLLEQALQEAKANKVGVHSIDPPPLVRNLKNAVEDFAPSDLVHVCQSKKVKMRCTIEYIFDGSRMRCLVTDENPVFANYIYSSFTLILAGVACPRVGNPRLDPPTQSEPFAEEARAFVDMRLLQRELPITLHGTDKSVTCVVGTVHHPRGSIAVELLKNGLGRVSDWTARIMDPHDLPALRFAENGAKRTNTGVWHSYAPPELTGASEIVGTVVEVMSGDTLAILPNGEEYSDESKLAKVSLASVRAPRIGNERMGKPDEPYAAECRDRLRVLTVGKVAKVSVNYERDIPMGPDNSVRRQFGTVSVGKRDDVGEVLVAEGLAETQRHRDDDEKSERYDALVAAEHAAKEAKKGVHSGADYGKHSAIDLTDPKKAKAYSGSLMRAGTLKAVVEHVFNGARFKLHVPSENCHIVFACECLRCPQPSPIVPIGGARGPSKAAEPFGDNAKRHARLTVLQRTVEINCRGVTNGGVITGQMFVGQGKGRSDYSIDLLGAGLATIDERKLEYGEVARVLVDAQAAASNNKVGLWSIERKVDTKSSKTKAKVKSKEAIKSIKLSEIRSGRHFFYHVANDEAIKVIDDTMKLFTTNHGIKGAACEARPGKVVAALFNDGSGKSWYRAKIVERKGPGKVAVLFVDHGNVAVVPVASHLRPLEASLGVERIPAVAKEAELALIRVRPLDDDDGVAAARLFQRLCWGKELTARIHCEVDGKEQVTLYEPSKFSEDGGDSINEQLVSEGYAFSLKPYDFESVKACAIDTSRLEKEAKEIATAQDEARKSRAGMWRYGDIGDEDDEE